MDVQASVQEFLRDHAVVGAEKKPVSADESLLDSGLLDSASILELVAFLEQRFQISIDDEELVPENFDTINAVVVLVESKGANRDAGGGAPN